MKCSGKGIHDFLFIMRLFRNRVARIKDGVYSHLIHSHFVFSHFVYSCFLSVNSFLMIVNYFSGKYVKKTIIKVKHRKTNPQKFILLTFWK